MINFRVVITLLASTCLLPAFAEPLEKVASPQDDKLMTHPGLPGSVTNRHDPLAVYREAGIDQEQEKKIRQLAREFEDAQKVRLALMANLLKDMHKLQMEPDPDEKKALAKQDEINKVQAEMGTERIKLILKIRNVLTFDQKQRLIENMRPKKTL